MDDTEQKAIDALRAAGLEAEASAVEKLRASHRATIDQFHAAQRSSYAAGRADALESQPAPAAPVYPPDGTISPFTVINLGTGRVQMGDSIHDNRLPALWFGKNGQGMGHEEVLNRQAHEGETLAVVTFANVEGLDVLLDVIQRIRRVSFAGADTAVTP